MNPYLAIRTAGATTDSDYTWKTLPHVSGNLHVSLAGLCDQAQSLAVVRRNDLFDAYLGGVETGLIDYRQRDILASIAFCGLTEAAAHNLIVFAIEHAEEFAQLLLATICRDSADKWRIDTIHAEKILDTANQYMKVVHGLPPFMDAWERFYTTYTADKKSTLDELSRAKSELIKLGGELKKHSFSEGSGLKLMVSYGPSQEGYDRALAEADRFLWYGGNEVDLIPKRKKKTAIVSTPFQKSSPHSTLRSHEICPQPSGAFRNNNNFKYSTILCWAGSNKGLLIICAGLLVGITLGIKSCKKKDEPEDKNTIQQEVPQVSSTPNNEQNKKSHRNFSNADENKDHVNQNTDLKNPTDNEKREE